MKEGVKKSISLILVLTLLVQLLPMVAFGVGDEADDLDISTDSETVSMQDDDAEIVGEEDALREESVKHFRLQDGAYMLVEYETAVHYQTADGSWEEIDNTLQKTGQQYVAQAGDMTRKFAASLDSGFLFETAYQGQSVSMSLARRSSRAKRHRLDTGTFQILQHSPRRGGYTGHRTNEGGPASCVPQQHTATAIFISAATLTTNFPTAST